MMSIHLAPNDCGNNTTNENDDHYQDDGPSWKGLIG